MFLRRPLVAAAAAVLLSGGAWVKLAAAEDSVDIFNTFKVSTTCTAEQRTTLDKWFDESYDMLDAAAKGWKNYGNDIYVRKLATLFFGLGDDDDGEAHIRGEMESYMDKTLDFLEHTDGDRIRPDQIPYLFCGSTFMEAKSPSDPAQDPDGDTYPSPNLDKLGLPATIEEMYGTQVASSGDPYWISEMGSYVFERDPELARKFCDKKKNLGLTFDYTLPGGGNTKTQIMMLCNHVFTSTLYKEKLSAAGDITKGKTLRSNAPRSVTLLHEMFHVANGHNLLAGDGEEYLLDRIIDRKKVPASVAQKNPESYAFFGLAMYYYKGGWLFEKGKAKKVDIPEWAMND